MFAVVLFSFTSHPLAMVAGLCHILVLCVCMCACVGGGGMGS